MKAVCIFVSPVDKLIKGVGTAGISHWNNFKKKAHKTQYKPKQNRTAPVLKSMYLCMYKF